MKLLVPLPIYDKVQYACNKCRKYISAYFIPRGEGLYVGYCGEQCRQLLVEKGVDPNQYVIAGLESPGDREYFRTYDLVFPQGGYDEHCDDGTLEKTALREFYEETGISLSRKKDGQPIPIAFLGTVGKRRPMAVYIYQIPPAVSWRSGIE